jgi:hypothetical protein
MTKQYIKDEEKVRLKFISTSIQEPAFVVLQYIQKTFGDIAIEYGKFVDLAEFKSKKGKYKRYLRFVDVAYKRSQWIMAKELNVPVSEIRKRIVHHQKTTFDDTIQDLILFPDIRSHTTFHSKKLKGEKQIFDFIENYIEKELELIREVKERAETSEELAEAEIIEKKLIEYIPLFEKMLEAKRNKKTLPSVEASKVI